MSVYDERPWLRLYPPGIPPDLEPPTDTPLDSFLAAAAAAPGRPFIHEAAATLTYGDVDRGSDAFAAALLEFGLSRGDRVAVNLQNSSEFAIAQLGIWKAGGVQVPVNPMVRQQELHHLLSDSGTRILVTQQDLWATVGREVAGPAGVQVAVVSGADVRDEQLVRPWNQVMATFADSKAPHPGLRPEDIAYLVYTSGTTGRPKGAMNTHGNASFSAEVFRRWLSIDDRDVILGGAPLYHVTGLVAHLGTAYRAGCALTLFGRFDAERCLEAIERTRTTFTVMSVTAFLALLNSPSIELRDLSSLSKVCSGGAPVPRAPVERWKELTGQYIHNIYGLTETTSPTHLPAPFGVLAPVDEASGTLSVGLPVPNTYVRVVDPESLVDVPSGELGELWIRGPQVVPGYWERPEATKEALVDGYLRTGDVGRMDSRGYFFVVDRIKDMINASGYKVWPREVEDFLYQHPAVREAAVVGVPDPYRGETVKAFVSLKPGTSATESELIDFCRRQMAAYKYPRSVTILGEIPKTESGKILRRELRQAVATAEP